MTYLVPKGSYCPFAKVISYNPNQHVSLQIPPDTDIVHFNYQPAEEPEVPYLVTIHGNLREGSSFFKNTNFISKNHAARYGSETYVYNGLNWNEYGRPVLNEKKNFVHFLGKAAWKVKNVRGAISIAHRNRTEIKVMGGSRINFKMGLRVTTSRWATFCGMVGGEKKLELLKHSGGLIFPVLWHEPFGLALIESLYFGCPVLGTTFGSLPELVPLEVGFLSDSMDELTEAFGHLDQFNRRVCHEYAASQFNSVIMARRYLDLYERILNGESIGD